MIIDFEHHYLPEELWLGKGGVKGESKIFYERGLPRGNLQQELFDIDEHLRVMDAVGIDLSVLSIAVSADDPTKALEECKIWNDRVAEVVELHPSRFVGMAPVPPLGGRAAFDELERAVRSLGLKGVVIRSQASGLSLDAKEFYPFYEKVCALDVPIFIHPSGVPDGFDILNAPYDLHRQIGRELDLIVATTRLILSGVLEDFPDLKLVISHKGGGIAALRGTNSLSLCRAGRAGHPHAPLLRRIFEQALFQSGRPLGRHAIRRLCADHDQPQPVGLRNRLSAELFHRSDGDQDLHREHKEPESSPNSTGNPSSAAMRKSCWGWRDEFRSCGAMAIAPRGRTAAGRLLRRSQPPV